MLPLVGQLNIPVSAAERHGPAQNDHCDVNNNMYSYQYSRPSTTAATARSR